MIGCLGIGKKHTFLLENVITSEAWSRSLNKRQYLTLTSATSTKLKETRDDIISNSNTMGVI